MRLLELTSNGKLRPTKDSAKAPHSYAILSHTWGCDDEEVTFQDLLKGSGESKSGYTKIRLCGEQADRDGLKYFWADTCCIDKTNSVELSEAINSMYRWYHDAHVCYVYLSDVDTWQDLDRSRWFKRGWTLQELLAPKHMVFFNREWKMIDNRSNLSPTISRITGIPARVIWNTFSGSYSVAQVISWASDRETTREEDIAYCLLGLLGVNMPLIYGEGSRAFERLQQEFMRTSTDHSLFSWVGSGGERGERGSFAQSPKEFRHCKDISIGESHSLDFSLTNRGLRVDLPLMRLEDGNFAAVLDAYDQDHRRCAIYLKEQRAGVYRRVRCIELHKVGPSEMIPAPKTVYIEPAVPRILGRDQPPPQGDEHSIRIDFRAALQQGFYLEQYYSIDDLLNRWKSLDDGNLVLTLISSGQYAGLWFKNAESGDQFTVVLGIHNWKAWLDITDIGIDESLESVVDEYYHFRKTCYDDNRICRCGAQWKSLQRMAKPLLGGLSAHVSIDSIDLEREFIVKIQLRSVDEGRR